MNEWGGVNTRGKGVVTVWTALMLVFLVGLVGLGIDTGYVLLGAHRLQNASDAAALAGALQVRSDLDDARMAAINCALANTAAGSPVLLSANGDNSSAGDIVIGRYDRDAGLFTPTTDSPNAVKVVAQRSDSSAAGQVSLIFGRMFGVPGVDLSREAIAMVGGGTGAGLIALDEDSPRALEVSGAVSVGVSDGAIQVNSVDSQAVRCNGGPTLLASDLNVCGDVQFIGGVDFDGNLNVGVAAVGDPLGFLPEIEPDVAGDLGAFSVTGGVHDLTPGYYSGGIKATGGTLNLAPGIYVLDGEGFDIGGNTTVLAEGVMLYITGSGGVDFGGTGSITLTPPDPDQYSYPDVDIYEGVSIFQDRDNTTAARIIGTSLMDLTGTIYLPEAHVALSGTGDGFGNQLIGGTILVSGTGDISISYDGRFPAPGNNVFLVE